MPAIRSARQCPTHHVIPLQSGTHAILRECFSCGERPTSQRLRVREREALLSRTLSLAWVPAFAGMTFESGHQRLPRVILGRAPRTQGSAISNIAVFPAASE